MLLKMLRLIPLMVLVLIAYNFLILFAGEPTKEITDPVFNMLGGPLFELPMISGGVWTFTLEHLFIVVSLVFLFFEVVKATSTGGAAMAEMAISTVVFIIYLVEFLLVKNAASSLFFILMLISLIDVLAGYIISVKVARRDLAIGGAGLL